MIRTAKVRKIVELRKWLIVSFSNFAFEGVRAVYQARYDRNIAL